MLTKEESVKLRRLINSRVYAAMQIASGYSRRLEEKAMAAEKRLDKYIAQITEQKEGRG